MLKNEDELLTGVTASDIKWMTFQLAVRNNIPQQFSQNKKTKYECSYSWLDILICHSVSWCHYHEVVYYRKCKNFFDKLKYELQNIKYKYNKIFTVCETGINIVQQKVSKILTVNGKKNLLSAEKGPLILICRIRENWKLNYPIENTFRHHWWMPFVWLDPAWDVLKMPTTFRVHSKIILRRSSFAGINGHYSQQDVIDITHDNGVSIIYLPTHSTDHMRHLDVSFKIRLKHTKPNK